MSQHWEDRTDSDRRAILRLLHAARPRPVARGGRAGDLVIALLLIALFWAFCGTPRPW
jgi:hypothetical protein